MVDRSGTDLGFLVLRSDQLKGRTFAELDEMFEAKVPTRQFGKYVTSVQRSQRQVDEDA